MSTSGQTIYDFSKTENKSLSEGTYTLTRECKHIKKSKYSNQLINKHLADQINSTFPQLFTKDKDTFELVDIIDTDLESGINSRARWRNRCRKGKSQTDQTGHFSGI